MLDGVPPTGLQLLRWKRVLLTLWKKGLEQFAKWRKVVAPSGAPPEELYENNLKRFLGLARQNRRTAIASDFRVDGAKSPEIPQKEGVLGSEIAAQNRKSPATFHRTLKSQCSIAWSCLGNRSDCWGPRWASQSQIAKIAAISVR